MLQRTHTQKGRELVYYRKKWRSRYTASQKSHKSEIETRLEARMGMEGDLTWGGSPSVQYTDEALYTCNLHNFINQCHLNRVNKKETGETRMIDFSGLPLSRKHCAPELFL